ncbi:unnamed protein product [Rotaria sp. Silwood1]|nr:unnamed protein product [Rotaria sp. Silwood1]
MSKPTSPHENLTKFRYTDLLAEPIARLLSPIKGYEAAPLVSLEQAVTSIAIFFDCIEENVWIVKENSKTPSDGLNQDESVAVHLYTMQFDSDPSFYQLLNLTLRGENSDNFKRWFAYLKLFMTALHKLPSHLQTVWRGVCGVDLKSQPMSKVSLNESTSFTTTIAKVKEAPSSAKPSSKYKKLHDIARISPCSDSNFSTLSPPMQEAVINIIREAIVEGTDEEDIKSIIVSELIQYYGGTWWVHITPTPET